jgi:hypothetical protein
LDRGIPIHWKQWGSWHPSKGFQAGKSNIVVDRDGQYAKVNVDGYERPTVLSKKEFQDRISAAKEPSTFIHGGNRREVSNFTILGKEIAQSPKNYINWDDYREWDITAKEWSLPGDYQPLTKKFVPGQTFLKIENGVPRG